MYRKFGFDGHIDYVTGVYGTTVNMADSIEPYAFEPLMTTAELEAMREGRRRVEEHAEDRVETSSEARNDHNRWCSCERCPVMGTAQESICCREVREAMDKMGSNGCITVHTSFDTVCLDREVLRTALIAMSDVRFDRYAEPTQPR